MSPRRLARNEARLVPCSARCGTLVWLAGALPQASDPEFVCPTCTARACEDACLGARMGATS